MKYKILAVLPLVLLVGPIVASADMVTGDFTNLNGSPSASGGLVTFSLNANGTIAASLSTTGAKIFGFGFDSVAYNLPESGFSPTLPDNTSGWLSNYYGTFPSGFFCTLCGTGETWTIGNPGAYSSVFDVLGGPSTAYDFVLFDANLNQWFASAAAVPEPGTLALLGLGLAGLGLSQRRRAN